MNCPDCNVEMELRQESGLEKKISIYRCGTCKNEFHAFSGVIARYRDKEEDFVCTKCGSEILTRTVAHTVRDGLFAFSGSGKVQTETVPYCPKCEHIPGYHGKAVTENGEPTV